VRRIDTKGSGGGEREREREEDWCGEESDTFKSIFASASMLDEFICWNQSQVLSCQGVQRVKNRDDHDDRFDNIIISAAKN
jgi:hypothetical protein